MGDTWIWASLMQKNENGSVTSSIHQGFVIGICDEDMVRGVAFRVSKAAKPYLDVADILVMKVERQPSGRDL